MKSKPLASWLCLLVLLLFSSLSAEEKQPPRIAILSSDKYGWSDLLMARLSANPAISLVERDDLGKALNEVELKDLLGDSKKRSRFGEIAGADFLALLSVTEDWARLVVCDTHLGVTLQDQSIRIAGQPQEKVLGVLTEMALQSVRSFAGGVKQIVAVPNFLCRDLTFDFSYLQSDYAEVLRSAYRQIPGTAVVAIEEAKAIAAERDIAGLGQKERIVSVFIEGEYRTERDPQSGRASVEITLQARDAAKLLMESKLTSVPTSEAGKEIMAVFSRELAALTRTGETNIDESSQYRMLIERADQFTLIGDFLRSTELREAALLLRPEDNEQRLLLIREYIRHNKSPFETHAWPEDARSDGSNPLWVAASNRCVSDCRRSIRHCEYLVVNRRINREEASILCYQAIESIFPVRSKCNGAPEDGYRITTDFLRHVYPVIASLDPSPGEPQQNPTKTVIPYCFPFSLALVRCDSLPLGTEDLELISDLLLHLLPKNQEPDYDLSVFLRMTPILLIREKTNAPRFSSQDYLDFLDKLSASDRPVVRLYGRYGKLCRLRVNGETSPALLEETKGVLADVVAAASKHTTGQNHFIQRLREDILQMEAALKKQSGTVAPVTTREAPVQPTVFTSRVLLKPIGLRLANAKHESERLAPGTKWKSPGGWAALSHYKPLCNGLDASWSAGAVFFMRSPGVMEPVLVNEKLAVADVAYDGRYVWVASYYNWGLSVLNAEGRELVRIGKKQGLPPCNYYGVAMHPIEPGRVLLAGTFGNEERGWIAVVRYEDGKSTVEVIHEATKIQETKGWNDHNSMDAKKAFSPELMIEHVIPGPKPRRIIFILRRSGQPLMLDLDDLNVSVYASNSDKKRWFPRCDPPGNAFLSEKGILWVAGSKDDFQSFRFDEDSSLFAVMRERPECHYGNYPSGSLARDGDWLYYAGEIWRRLNSQTGVEEILVENTRALPHYGSGGKWRLHHSSHYGLVSFFEGTGELYHMEITP